MGAVPATIAVIGGVPKVGLTHAELEMLAKPSSQVLKCSRRDLAFLSAQGLHGSTTVAATSYLAGLAGIRVFATGGLGGVHYGYESTMDVSCDLYELARTSTAVVCSGIKSILDIPKTLEVLESLGVPVVTYRSEIFPAFFTNDSGVRSPYKIDTPREAAELLAAADDLTMQNGMILAVPNPNPADSKDIQLAILEGLKQVRIQNIQGSKITPFLLSYVNYLTKGKSLEANVSLVLNNAKVATEIAVEYAALRRGDEALFTKPPPANFSLGASSTKAVSHRDRESVICVGGAVVDLVATSSQTFIPGSSNPGQLEISFGGVARNIGEAIARQGAKVRLMEVNST